jgi:type I restriction enzyme, R subunit
VSETKKNASQPLERKKSISFDALIEQIAMGRRDEDALSSLAARLAALDRKLGDEDRARMPRPRRQDPARSGQRPARCHRPRQATGRHRGAPRPRAHAGTGTRRHRRADRYRLPPLRQPAARNLLKDIKQKTDIVIDEITTDEVTGAGFDMKRAEETITSFKHLHRREPRRADRLQILYNQPQGRQRLTYAAIRELVQRLTDPPHYLTTANVWQAYKRLDAPRCAARRWTSN